MGTPFALFENKKRAVWIKEYLKYRKKSFCLLFLGVIGTKRTILFILKRESGLVTRRVPQKIGSRNRTAGTRWLLFYSFSILFLQLYSLEFRMWPRDWMFLGGRARNKEFATGFKFKSSMGAFRYLGLLFLGCFLKKSV